MMNMMSGRFEVKGLLMDRLLNVLMNLQMKNVTINMMARRTMIKMEMLNTRL